MRCGGRAWRWGRHGLGPGWALLLAGVSLVAHAGEWSLKTGQVGSGAGDGAAGSLTLSGTVGQVVADSAGVEADGGLRLQAGRAVHVVPWGRPPVPVGDSVPRVFGERVARVSMATLLANDTDADGDALAWVRIGRAEPAGATVTVEDGIAVYVATAGDMGHGSFEYEVRDVEGNVARGFVTVLETAGGGVETRPNAVRLEADGVDRVFTGIGVPGRRYRVQYTLEAAAPHVWREFEPVAELEAATSGALGLFRHVDRNPGEALRLYRAVLVP